MANTGQAQVALPVKSNKRLEFLEVLTSEKYFKWVLLIPLLITLLIFMLYPLIYCINFSLQEVVRREATFVGLNNYRAVLRDSAFWTSMARTGYLLVISIAVELLVGLGIAMLFNREFKGQNIVRGLCLLPLLISPLAMSMIWNFIFQYDFGIVNQVLQYFGATKVMWWSPQIAFYTVAFISIWQWTPFSAFVLLSGLKGLPKDAFEAARVDGASPWLTFRKLTLPLLTPLIIIIILLRTMWLIRIFDPLYGTTRGGVGTETLDWMVYRVAFVFFDTGFGSTMAIISLFLTIIICSIMFKVLMRALNAAQ